MDSAPPLARLPASCDAQAELAIIGAGAAGLTAALAAKEAGVDALVFERDAVPSGSTSLSAGLIPAAGTRWQAASGIVDSPASFSADIMAKAKGTPDPAIVQAVTEAVGPALEWLCDRYGLEFSVIENFRYPGHGAARMHGLPSRSGRELIDRLRNAAEEAGIAIITKARVTTLLVDGAGDPAGLAYLRPDGQRETLAVRAIILANNGYGGNRDLVRRFIPELAGALYFGHPGNQGEALVWGEALGAATRDLTGHQGHGSVATPHGVLITWATISEGGVQVNAQAQRFHNEAEGYSEAAARVVAQSAGIAFTIFDARIAGIARQFEDFRNAEAAGAIISAGDVPSLAARLGLDEAALGATLATVAAFKAGRLNDPFLRNFANVAQLEAPFCAVKVEGALFHTQGGLRIDASTRVLRPDGTAIPGIFAAGGAACGVSGPAASGYLSGNGLLTAVALGRIAGQAASGALRNDT